MTGNVYTAKITNEVFVFANLVDIFRSPLALGIGLTSVLVAVLFLSLVVRHTPIVLEGISFQRAMLSIRSRLTLAMLFRWLRICVVTFLFGIALVGALGYAISAGNPYSEWSWHDVGFAGLACAVFSLVINPWLLSAAGGWQAGRAAGSVVESSWLAESGCMVGLVGCIVLLVPTVLWQACALWDLSLRPEVPYVAMCLLFCSAGGFAGYLRGGTSVY